MLGNKDKRLITWFITCICFILLDLVWMWLELLLYGEVQHRVVDDIIGVFIFYLMYSNVKYKLIDKFITK